MNYLRIFCVFEYFIRSFTFYVVCTQIVTSICSGSISFRTALYLTLFQPIILYFLLLLSFGVIQQTASLTLKQHSIFCDKTPSFQHRK